MAHLWGPCLPGHEHEAKIRLLSSQETSWPGPPVNDCKKEEMNTSPPEAERHQKMFDFTPSPFGVKEAWTLTWGRWVFGTLAHHPLGLLAFRIKSLPLAPLTRLSIYRRAVRGAVRAWTRSHLLHFLTATRQTNRMSQDSNTWNWHPRHQRPFASLSHQKRLRKYSSRRDGEVRTHNGSCVCICHNPDRHL